ncbi:MAG: hypothetical protein ABR974_00445 [Bacteroidales bacterium]|jgi:hypothetical protein
MRAFNDFEKQVIKVLAKTEAPATIDLIPVLEQILPEDMFIGKTEDDDILQEWYYIKYKMNQMAYVQGILSIKISSFVQLIDELVKNNYLVKDAKPPDSTLLKVGKLSTDSNYVRYNLGSNLTYDKLRDVLLSTYYTTEDLHNLPKRNFQDITTFLGFRQLRWTRIALYVTVGTVIADIVLKILEAFCRCG